MFANVIVEYPVKSLDRLFTYSIPTKILNDIRVGMSVLVPFGKKSLNAIVTEIHNKKPNYITKSIIRINNPDIYLTKEQMDIAKYIAEQTLCPLISAYQTILPGALKVNKEYKDYNKYETYIELSDNSMAEEYINMHPRCIKQIEIINLLKDGCIIKKELPYSSLKVLIVNGIVKEIIKRKDRINYYGEIYKENNLTDEQRKAYNEVLKNINEYHTYLLQGVTGSGKTEVYMHLIKNIIDKGKTAICLVPEICLTTQTVDRFYKRFGNDVAIFHSGLSIGEKYDEYKKIYDGKAKIVVGTRSSIFVPLKDLGIIIIDEEHSETYKQESTPRYDAISVAEFRAKYNNIPLILASATPSLESKARALKGVYNLLRLDKRVNNKELPDTIIVDMKEEIRKKNFIFSDCLKEKINERLLNNEQIILLLNRRGFSTFINCSNCGYTFKCPNCEITLTYHKTTDELKCHYCNYTIRKENLCPECRMNSLNYYGLGTERLEDEISRLFPKARVKRMDQDTTSKKGSYQKIIDDFSDHKYDILLGTQMISKGLDFKNVTLVGIINADTSLNIPDFRANEKTFNLLYQAAGRCGRDEKSGEVIIQTYNPDNYVLKLVSDNDYDKYFAYEMDIRHKLNYPPYVFLALISIKGKDINKVELHSKDIKKYLDEKLLDKAIVYEPTPSAIIKVNNIYNYQILVKYKSIDIIKRYFKDIDKNFITNKDVNIEISFNPSHF